MHPVRIDLDYAPVRNRLTTFFRPLVAIPWIVWVYLYGIAAIVAAFVAWFALLFTKRYPQGLYDFIAGYVQLVGEVGGFTMLATDDWPSFLPNGGDYPVRIEIAGPAREYRRAQTFFKLLLAFPQQVLAYGLGAVLGGAAFVTWWRVLFTGRQSVTMHDAMRVCLAYSVRSSAFALLLTEVHPRLLDLPPQQLPSEAPAQPGPNQLPAGTAPAGA